MKRVWAVALMCGATLGAWAQADGFVNPNRPAVNPMSGEPINVKVAGMKEDMASTQKDVKELALRVEGLERQKAALESKVNTAGGDTVTRDELKLMEARMTAAMNEAVKAEGQRVQREILDEIKNTQQAMKAQAAPTTPAAQQPAKIAVSDEEKQSYMKEGIRYTVQPGDTLSAIARKHKSSVRAIMVVNGIESPNKLWVGKELFVPVLEK